MAKTTYSKGGTRVIVDMPDFSQATKDLGIDNQGEVQAFATKSGKIRMDKRTPLDTSMLIKTAIVRTDEIEYVQVYSSVMHDPIDWRSGNPWNYSGAPQRGGNWEVKMIAAEGDQWLREVQNFSDRLRTK